MSYLDTSHPGSVGRQMRELVVDNDNQRFGIPFISISKMRSLTLNWQRVE